MATIKDICQLQKVGFDLNKIDRTPENINVEYHNIIPVSCNGKNDDRNSKYNNEQFNIVGLTLDEHFFAHLLLVKIYKEKYGINHKFYKNMLNAIMFMGSCQKYQIKTSKLYKKIKLECFANNLHKTTTGRMWVTNGVDDKFLKPNEQILGGFYKGRSYGGGEKRKHFCLKISKNTQGRKPWNKGKCGCYSDKYKVYWWNNGSIEKMCKNQPGKDFKMGRLKNKLKPPKWRLLYLVNLFGLNYLAFLFASISAFSSSVYSIRI